MKSIKVSKRVTNLVEKFERGEITEKNYYSETKGIPYWDVEQFWGIVVNQGKSEEVNRLVASAKEVLEAMDENDIFDYSSIMYDLVERYKDDPDTDVGLQTHVVDSISDCALTWAEYEDKEIYETLSELDENWMWVHVFPVAVADYVRENALAVKALESLNLSLF